jgi:DNA mismatch repair protein MutH
MWQQPMRRQQLLVRARDSAIFARNEANARLQLQLPLQLQRSQSL